MSFILDALKKSELERQRQLVPGLVDPARAPVRTRLPVWAVALGILLAINLGVLSYVLLRQAPSAPSGTPNRVVAASPAAGVPLTAPGPVANTAAMPTTAATPAAAATSAAAPANAVPSGTADHFSPMDGAPTYAPEATHARRAAGRAPRRGRG
jgi:general secretion pathway protein B